MRVKFYGYGTEFETRFTGILRSGIEVHCDSFEIADIWDDDATRDDSADIAMFVGLRERTRDVVDAYRSAGKRVIILDKGAIRERGISTHKRVYLDGGTSLAYLMRVKRPADRWEALEIDPAPIGGAEGGHLLYAGNSQKVHDYWRLPDAARADDSAEETCLALARMAPARRVVHRPKPRALDFREIPGVALSVKPETIEDALAGAACLITHFSHCAVNAVVAGVPVVALGPNPARPIAGKYLEQALSPPVYSEDQRRLWLCAMAYAQWTDAEIASGEMWEFIRGEMAATLSADGEPLGPRPIQREEDGDEGLRDGAGEGRFEGTAE